MMKILLFLFGRWINKYVQQTVSESIVKYDAEHERRRVEIQTRDLQKYINHLVIVIDNEGSYLLGVVESIRFITKGSEPVPVIEHLLTGEKLLVFGKIMHYTEQRFNALFSISRNDLNSLIWNYTDEPFTKPSLSNNEILELKARYEEAIDKWNEASFKFEL